ncbi:SEC-C metal-binding domain-containing protein [Bhargavaea ullalensis]|uniref:Tetratricopeptide (TPR) repeat protein n=1 Tax=Bhargavaea ullalensis TaxID=1265685 RepID=A0ABV2G791_9BACL
MTGRETAVVRRNDPCPCGSGQKYKKCCGSDTGREHLRQQTDRETAEVIAGFFEAHPTPAERRALLERHREYGSELERLHGEEEAAAIIGDLYFFREAVGEWNGYVRRSARPGQRAQTQDAVRGFEDPLFLAALVAGAGDGILRLSDLVSGEAFELRTDAAVKAAAGDVLIGFFVPQPGEDHLLMPLNSLVHAQGADAGAMRKLKEAAMEAGLADAQEFHAKHPLAAYRLFGQAEGQPISVADDVTEVCDRMEEFMIGRDLKDDRLLEAFFHYIGGLETVPSEAIAGAVWHAVSVGSFKLGWTLEETAGRFGTNPAETAEFAEAFAEFIAGADVPDDEEEEPVYAFGVGTDPIAAEFSQWNLFMHLAKAEVADEKALRRLMEAYDGKPYMPASPVEEAQVRAYEAYLAKEPGLRTEKSAEALRLDSQNSDALLLAAERAEAGDARLELLRRAVEAGKGEFEEEMDVAWGYLPNRPYLRARFALAVHLWELGRMEEAFKELYALLRLNPGDHQGARYVALSALISLGRLDEAESLLDHYEEPGADNAFYAWFRWAAERRRNVLGTAAEEAYRTASDQNPYAVKWVRDRPAADPYPKSAAVTPRSPEEARLIWTFLEKTLEKN